jgi:hypothetical protein
MLSTACAGPLCTLNLRPPAPSSAFALYKQTDSGFLVTSVDSTCLLPDRWLCLFSIGHYNFDSVTKLASFQMLIQSNHLYRGFKYTPLRGTLANHRNV